MFLVKGVKFLLCCGERPVVISNNNSKYNEDDEETQLLSSVPPARISLTKNNLMCLGAGGAAAAGLCLTSTNATYAHLDYNSYANKFEAEDEFNLNEENIIRLINETLDDYTDYEERLDTQPIQIWTKMNSKYLDNVPLIKIKYVFDEKYSQELIAKVLMDVRNRSIWDKSTLKTDILEEYNNFLLYYYVSKAPMWFSNRDFVEKKLAFPNNDAIYIYYSCSSDEKVGQDPKLVRGSLIYGGNKITTENGKTIMRCFSQCDLQISKIPPAIIRSFVPSSAQIFVKEITKYMDQLIKEAHLLENEVAKGIEENGFEEQDKN